MDHFAPIQLKRPFPAFPFVSFILPLLFLCFIGCAPRQAFCLNGYNSEKLTDTLPDGRYLWEMTEYEKAIFYGDPMETEIERQWRLRQAEEMGHYQPSIEQSKLFPDLLRNLGIDVSGAKLQLYNPEGQLIETIRLP